MAATDPIRSTRRRRFAGFGLVAVLAVVLVAVVVVRGGGEKVINANGDVLVLVGKEDATDSTGLAKGVLADVGGCLGLVRDGDSPGEGLVLIWSHGTTIRTPDPLRVSTGDRTYEIGDTVRFGGEGMAALDESSYFYQQVPETCRSAGFWTMG